MGWCFLIVMVLLQSKKQYKTKSNQINDYFFLNRNCSNIATWQKAGSRWKISIKKGKLNKFTNLATSRNPAK